MRFFVLALLAMVLTGCGSTLKVTKPDANGYYKTTAKIKPENILVAEKVDMQQYRPMFFAKIDEKNAKYQDFFSASIKNTGYFDKVVTKQDLEQIILAKGLTDKVTSVSDMIGLHHARKNLGPFLVGELTTEWKGGYNFEADLKVVDPEDGKVVFQVKNTAFNWDGLDQPLFLPMFNAFIDWAKSNSK
jgi:hypothetical protein